MASTADQWDIVSSVGLTALGVAAARALEGHRADALVRDEFAERFVTAARPPVPMPTRPEEGLPDWWRWLADFLAVRSRFFDEYFAEATGAGITQVVVLAAGLDARAHRLDWPAGCEVFEVDQPAVLRFKDEVFDEAGAVPACTRHVVAADLREDWVGALHAAGFDPERPTAWLVEGLLTYLPAAADERLFTEIDRLSAPGSRVGVEYVADVEAVLADPRFQAASREYGMDVRELWSREPRRPVAERLRALGWDVRAETVADAADRYGRVLDEAPRVLFGDPVVLLTGTRLRACR